MEEKVSIILFSGTTDRIIAASVIAQAAAVLGQDVKIFATFWGLLNFVKGEKKMMLPKEFESMGPMLLEGMKRDGVKSWYEMLKEAKEFGAKIYACSMTASIMGIKKEDLDPIIDGVVGAATFVQESSGGNTLFI
ncbi:MAG: DsrE/DsrF/DrsH-like family protein [Thermoplasmatales archaeon]